METPLYVLLSQQDALQRQMDVAAQNIANANTTGFKSRDVLFSEYVAHNSNTVDNHFVLDRATLRNTAQGTMQRTDNPLDVGISGKGYFSVQTPTGTMYTRQGSFQMDPEGNLVTPDGFKVADAGGAPISIPTNAREIAIGNDGTISTDVGNVGRLSVVGFADEQQLEEVGNGLYKTSQQAVQDDSSQLLQGNVEASNVNTVTQLTQVMEISRAYQRVASLINNEQERMRNAIRTLAKTA